MKRKVGSGRESQLDKQVPTFRCALVPLFHLLLYLEYFPLQLFLYLSYWGYRSYPISQLCSAGSCT